LMRREPNGINLNAVVADARNHNPETPLSICLRSLLRARLNPPHGYFGTGDQ
jgi:hypothetical protein